jgi:DNA polymerase-3 subunit gamma/tau
MGHFVVSARKYRPQTFDTVVGQEAITTTLKSAIQNEHLAQAFLFCGPRGVGKTTTARILARTINCENLGQDLNVCGACEPCRSFEEGHSLNIYELDAASNNSVENIRDLTLQVKIAPQIGSKKIYIIDEVHMLSSAAFNAFLKTLEEPPSYAIFILATTEKHKILPTILSRCQVFDFKRIAITDMVAHLQGIAQNQGVQAETEALHVIAEKADGGLRDALSIFDQLVSYSGAQLTHQDVLKNLNVLDHATYFEITNSLLAGNVADVLVRFDQVLQQGFDGHHFVNGLGGHLRNLLVAKDNRSLNLLEVSDSVKNDYVTQAGRTSDQFLFNCLDRIAQCDVQYKASKQPRLLVELTLIRCCDKPSIGSEAPTLTELSSAASDDPEPAPKVTNAIPAPALVEEPVPDLESPAQRRRASAVSINSYIKPEEEEDSDESNSTESEEIVHEIADIPTDDLLKAWNAFAKAKKSEGKNSLHATLMYKEPRLDGNTIHFVIVNEVQERALREERVDLLNELRSTLRAPGLELTLEKEEVGELKPRYTPMDRFKILAERNPDLLTLKDKLDLDFS